MAIYEIVCFHNVNWRALSLRQGEKRNCGLSVVYIQKDGATLLVGTW